MKTIFKGWGITLRAPTTGAEWLRLFFTGAGIYYLIAGKPQLAMDAFQISLLFDIVSRLPEKT